MKKSILSFVLGIVLFAIVGWLLGVFSGFVHNVFQEASDTVKAAAIAALVSVVTFSVGRYFEQERERKARANVEKIKVYERFFEFYFTMFSNSDYVDRPEDKDWVVKFLIEFQRELLLWGSDGVLRSYINFRQALQNHANVEQNDDDLALVLAPTIKAAAMLLRSMRQDIGYRFTSFSAQDLAILQLQSSDPHFSKLLKELE